VRLAAAAKLELPDRTVRPAWAVKLPRRCCAAALHTAASRPMR
jgi:hypothetical protein